MDNYEHIRHTQLSKSLEPIIWVIEITGKIKGDWKQISATGFSMGNDGLVLTRAHTIHGLTAVVIKARKLNGISFETAVIKSMKLKWDLALSKVNQVTDCSVGEFVSDGSIWKGQPLLHIGHIYDLVGLYIYIYISPRLVYRCPK